MLAQAVSSVAKYPGLIRLGQGSDRFRVRLLEEPGNRRKVAAGSPELCPSVEFDPAVGRPPADPVCVNLVECLLVTPGTAAVGNGLVERREVFERGPPAFPCRVAQVLVEP